MILVPPVPPPMTMADTQAELQVTVMKLLKEDSFTARLLELVTEAVAQAVNRVNEAAEARLAALESELAATKTKLQEAEQRIEDADAYSRRNCVVLSGIPETAGEATDRLVLDIGRAAGVELSAERLDRSHRLGRPLPDKTRPIIAKCVSFNYRQKLFTKRKHLAPDTIRDHPILTRSVLSKTFISECLTPKNQHLLYVARQLKQRKMLWAAYTTNGIVKIKKTEEDAARQISDVVDLETVVGAGALREFQSLRTAAGAAGAAQRGADPTWATTDAVSAWVTERRRGKPPTGSPSRHRGDRPQN